MVTDPASLQPGGLLQPMMSTAPAQTGIPDSPAGGAGALVSISESDLVERTRAGEVEAFSELVRRNERVIYNLAYRFMRDGTLAEDMAQEAFLKAYRLLDGFRGECSFATWLYRVTCSVCLTEIHRRKRRGEVELTPAHTCGAAVDPQEVSEMPELVRRCVTELPERYATVVTLYYLQEVSYEDIAKAMKIPMGTLKTWMHRARQKLRKIVEAEIGAGRLSVECIRNQHPIPNQQRISQIHACNS